MKMSIKPSDDEINNLLNQCSDAESDGTTQYPGMTYEQGILNAIRWVIGDSSSNPME